MEYDFVEIITRIMELKNYSHEYEAGERLGFKRVAFSERKKRNSVPVDEIVKFCVEERFNTEFVLFGKCESNARPANLVPVYGSVPAGWPEDQPGKTNEEALDWIPVEGSTHGVGALRVEGHSMSPDIRDGVYVLYIQDFNIKPGDIIVTTDEFNRAMVKQYALKDGEPWLVSINSEYPSFKVNDHYRIVGRVFEKYDKSRVGRGR